MQRDEAAAHRRGGRAHLGDLGVDDCIEVSRGDALDPRVELEVLARRQQLEHCERGGRGRAAGRAQGAEQQRESPRTRVPLRAVAEEAAQFGLLRQDVVAGELGRAARREDVAREHLERRRLARAVDPEVTCGRRGVWNAAGCSCPSAAAGAP